MTKSIQLHPLSMIPLQLEVMANENCLATGTGFIIFQDKTHYLVTNKHVLSGTNPENGNLLSSTGAIPNKIKIWHHDKDNLGIWQAKTETLSNENGNKQWLEHPRNTTVDLAILKLKNIEKIGLYPLDLALTDTDIVVFPSDPVSIIGFPFGDTVDGKHPIWKKGHIASEIDLNYQGLPVFLVDTTSRPGMSGSPVIIRTSGVILTSNGWSLGGGEHIKFLGIYSGRTRENSELGLVWKPFLINEIINN